MENYELEILVDKNQNKLRDYLSKTERSASANDDLKKDDFSSPCTSNQRTRNVDAKDENFLSTFYGKSRLHLISTLATDLKLFVNELKQSADYDLKTRQQLPLELYNKEDNKINLNKDERVVFHLDMDCFFVSVSLRNKPNLQNQPIGIAHSKGKKANSKDDFSYSEIASCNYEARQYGLKNGMLVGTAKRLCPNLKLIDYDFEQYSKCSRHIYELVAQYTRQIKAVSCDEMFIDVTDLVKKSDGLLNPLSFATFIRQQIKNDLDCPSSIGIGTNMLISRLATKRAKPNGQVWIRSGEETLRFISSFKISDLPGIGASIMSKIHSKWDVNKCEELQKLKKNDLQELFGKKMGEKLYEFCRGIDSRPFLENDQNSNLASLNDTAVVKKSISTDVNYGIRFDTITQVHDFFRRLSGELCDRLKRYNLKGTKLTLKLKIRDPSAPIETKKYMGCGLCVDKTVSTPIHIATNDPDVISNCVIGLYRQHYLNNVDCNDLRGIGLQMDKLTSATAATVPKSESVLMKAFGKIKKTSEVEILELSDDNSNNSTTTVVEEARLEESLDYEDEYKTFVNKIETFINKSKVGGEASANCDDDDIDAIKRLLDDWIFWSANLLKAKSIDDDDIQIFKGYLLYLLIKIENIEKLFLILKLFKRLVIRNGNTEWIRHYKNINEEIQSEFYQKYDATLQIDE